MSYKHTILKLLLLLFGIAFDLFQPFELHIRHLTLCVCFNYFASSLRDKYLLKFTTLIWELSLSSKTGLLFVMEIFVYFKL